MLKINKKGNNPKHEAAVFLLNTNVADVSGCGMHEGFLYGLELELEGHNVEMEGVPSKNWRRVEDGSLRGESVEYVFNQPCAFEEAEKRVNRLFEMFQKNKVKLNNSYRTSTHVHLNFSDKTGKQVTSFFLLHSVIEEVLAYYCGDSRKGNLFCLSCRETEDLLDLLEQSIFERYNYGAFNNEVRYNAANLAALNKFGTIELRTMRGANTAEEVNEWLTILKHLYEFSCNNAPPPWRLVENLSHLGPEGFLNQIFPINVVNKLLKHWPPVRDLRTSLMEGVRLVQMLAYKLEEPWNAEPEVKHAKNPFLNVPPREEDVLETDRLVFPGGETWWVPRADRTEDGAFQLDPRGERMHYSEAEGCYVYEANGKPVKWNIHLGRRLIVGTDLERNANWYYYEYYEEREEQWEREEEDNDD